VSIDANAPDPNTTPPSTNPTPAPAAPGANAVGAAPSDNRWRERFLRAEDELKRLARYPLATLQVAFYCAVAWGAVGGGLGAGDLFWNDHFGHQLTVGVATAWLFATILVVTILLLPPRGLPGLPDDEHSSFRWEGGLSLFKSKNPGLRKIGHRVLLWLFVLLAVAYFGNWIAIALESADSVLVFKSQLFGLPFVVGYLGALCLGAVATSFLEGARERTAQKEWLLKAFDSPHVRIPTISDAVGEKNSLRLGSDTVTQLSLNRTELEARPDSERVAVNNLRTLLSLHALAFGFGWRIIVALVLAALLQLLLDWVIFPELDIPDPSVLASRLDLCCPVSAERTRRVRRVSFPVLSHRARGLACLLIRRKPVCGRCGSVPVIRDRRRTHLFSVAPRVARGVDRVPDRHRSRSRVRGSGLALKESHNTALARLGRSWNRCRSLRALHPSDARACRVEMGARPIERRNAETTGARNRVARARSGHHGAMLLLVGQQLRLSETPDDLR
jgi:hypothetical protein